jgi:hypothetical protein
MSDTVDKSEAWEVLCANTAKHIEFMKELSDALLKVRPLGGSELFVKRFGTYFADPKYCGAAIEEMSKRLYEARVDAVRWKKAYEEMRDLAGLAITSGDRGGK